MLTNATHALPAFGAVSRAPVAKESGALRRRYDPRMATARERARAEFTADLLTAARARLAVEGWAGLSLRAVARDLGVASSAVYRYVDSRDALLTLLIIEAYDAVGQVAEDAAAVARAAGADAGATWLAVCRAVRGWALANRSSFELVYGTPVPGYRAPEDTIPAALRIWGVIIGVLLAAHASGELRPAGPDFDPAGRVTEEVYDVAALPRSGGEVPPDLARAAVRSITLFTSLVGAISAELFGHLHRVGEDYGALFDVTVATAAAGVGIRIRLDG